MSIANNHSAGFQQSTCITNGYSIEITAKDLQGLREVAAKLPPKTAVAIAFLPGETLEARLDAAKLIQDLGFQPTPHFSARRLLSEGDFTGMLSRMVKEAGVKHCLAVAGDPAQALGPYPDTRALLESGWYEYYGIQEIGLAGHPDGHPCMSREECFTVLQQKCQIVRERGMNPRIVTQFCFDPDAVEQWLLDLRSYGIEAPVRVGIPGPANIKLLLKFASRCGVGASAAVMKKYGVSISKLIGTAGPDQMVDVLARRLTPSHGTVDLHFYPFGGLQRTVDWINSYATKLQEPSAIG